MSTIATTQTREVLERLLAERILVLDGSMGALLYSYNLTEEDVRAALDFAADVVADEAVVLAEA